MDQFPDESQMERSQDGSEPIRGGSIGLNRILNTFVDISEVDNAPRFHAVLISAFTIVRNVYGTLEQEGVPLLSDIEEGFVRDVNLFLEYFDTYLSRTWSRLSGDKYCQVIIYFPDYRRVDDEIRRDITNAKKTKAVFDMYQLFLAKHGSDEGQVKTLDHCRCFWMSAGYATYPHQEVTRKFRELATDRKSLYVSGDPVCLISHITLDRHMTHRLRNISLLESYTGELKKSEDFKFALDKEGRVPFQSAVHLVLGDSNLIKAQISPKIKKIILETAEQERWTSRSADDIRGKLAKITDIPLSFFRKYDFT